MKLIILLMTIAPCLFADKLAKDIEIPTGKIVDETAYWLAFNLYIDEQEDSITLTAAVQETKERLAHLEIRTKMHEELYAKKAVAISELEDMRLRRDTSKTSYEWAKYELTNSQANLAIHRARMEAALDQGYAGNLDEFVKKTNAQILVAKCQQRYLRVLSNRLTYDQSQRNYARTTKLYNAFFKAESYVALLRSRLRVAEAAIKVQSWAKLSKTCMAANIEPTPFTAGALVDLSKVVVPKIPQRGQKVL